MVPSRNPTTGKPAESQVNSTHSPPRFTNRFKFVSRKPYFKTTTKKTIAETTDQNLESTNQDSTENSVVMTTEPPILVDISISHKTQPSSLPQAKPSRKRPQILRISSRYSSKSTTTTTPAPTTTRKSFHVKTHSSPKYKNKETVAITSPFLKESFVPTHIDEEKFYSTPQYTADQFIPDIVTGDPIIRQIYESPQTINGQDFISKYTSSELPSSRRTRTRPRPTEPPVILITPGNPVTVKRRKPSPQAFEKISSRGETKSNNFRPVSDYDYYDSIEASVVNKIPEHSKVLLHSDGIIECLDQGNFPHPVSCKKFISCAKMDNDKIIGWEYTCPKNLSFDPIGGMCNWSAGLGCNES